MMNWSRSGARARKAAAGSVFQGTRSTGKAVSGQHSAVSQTVFGLIAES
jgi:hypothetical protein